MEPSQSPLSKDFSRKLRLPGEWANDFFKLGLVVITRITWVQMWGRSFSVQPVSYHWGLKDKGGSIHLTVYNDYRREAGCPVLEKLVH